MYIYLIYAYVVLNILKTFIYFPASFRTTMCPLSFFIALKEVDVDNILFI